MIRYGFVVIEDGKWKEVEFEFNSNCPAYDHLDFAEEYVNSNPILKNEYAQFKRNYRENKDKYPNAKYYNQIDFLEQYLGYIRISNFMAIKTSCLSYYRQSDEYNATKLGKERQGIINTYHSRGFFDINDHGHELPDHVYKQQIENKLFDTLAKEGEHSLS